jgi:hypothetical protein
LVSGLALALGILGRNSLRWRRAALVAVVVSALSLIVDFSLSVYRVSQMPFDPWMASTQAAQLHANSPTFPADQIAWSNRAPFTVPLPTVECACFSLVDKPAGPPPHPIGATAMFKNSCPGFVTFVVSRTANAQMATFYPWFAGRDRDFGVITLAPGQSVPVPLGGTYAGAYQPWICQTQAMAGTKLEK